jgi:enterochelin esterase-like enzyme
MNQLFDAALIRTGVPHVFRIYPGGHTGALWRSEAPHWLGMALGALAAEAERRGH